MSNVVNRFLGDTPARVAIKLIVLSVVVGIVMPNNDTLIRSSSICACAFGCAVKSIALVTSEQSGLSVAHGSFHDASRWDNETTAATQNSVAEQRPFSTNIGAYIQ